MNAEALKFRKHRSPNNQTNFSCVKIIHEKYKILFVRSLSLDENVFKGCRIGQNRVLDVYKKQKEFNCRISNIWFLRNEIEMVPSNCESNLSSKGSDPN